VTTLAVTLAFGLAVPVEASGIRIRSRTIGEAYAVLGADPRAPVLRRRRIAQYVDLAVFNMLRPREPDQWVRDPMDGQLQLVTSMRIRHDFGDFVTEAGAGSRSRLEAMDGRQIDLLWGYLRGDRLARGWLDFRLGRQFEQSGLDWFVLDGAWTRVRLPIHLGVESFGGFSSPGGSVFGVPTLDLDGTWGRGTDRLARPTVGAGVSVIDVGWLSARLAYRRTFTTTSLAAQAIAEPMEVPDTTVDQEVVSGSAALRLMDGVLTPHGAVRFDPALMRMTDLSAGLTWAIADGHVLRALFLRTRPAFDLDSIFNVFATGAFEDVRVAYEVRPGAGWTLIARTRARLMHSSETASAEQPERGTQGGFGGGAGASWQRRRFAARFGTDALGGGDGGFQLVSSLDTRTHAVWDRLAIDARAYAAYYDEPAVARQGWAAAVQAGIDIRLWRGLHVAVMGEETVSPLLKHSFRTWAALAAEWTVRPGGR
jgi:hypothetical protein